MTDIEYLQRKRQQRLEERERIEEQSRRSAQEFASTPVSELRHHKTGKPFGYKRSERGS